MAPRRGGGGGFGFSSSSSCSDNGAFTTTYSKGFLAAYCVYLVAFLVLLSLFGVTRKKHPAAKTVVTWPLFGLSLLFFFFTYISSLVTQVLYECGTIGVFDEIKGTIAVVVFVRIAEILLLAVVLIPLTSCLQRLIGRNANMIRIIHGMVLAFLSSIAIAFLAIESYNYYNFDAEEFGDKTSLFDQQNRLAVAYYILYMVVVVIAGIGLIMTLVQGSSKGVTGGSINIWIPLLALSMLLWLILTIVVNVYYGLQAHIASDGANIAYEFIIDFFQAFSFFCILMIAGSSAVAASGSSQTQEPVYNPATPVYGTQHQPVYQQPQQTVYQPAQQPVYQNYQSYQQPQQQYAYQQPQQQYAYQQQSPSSQAPEVVHHSAAQINHLAP